MGGLLYYPHHPHLPKYLANTTIINVKKNVSHLDGLHNPLSIIQYPLSINPPGRSPVSANGAAGGDTPPHGTPPPGVDHVCTMYIYIVDDGDVDEKEGE